MDYIDITPELFVIGGAACFGVEFLRALLIKIEDYPRLNAIWKYLPPIFGAVFIVLYPQAVKAMSLPLILAHGGASPAIFMKLYPLLKKAVVDKGGSALRLPETPEAPPTEERPS